MSAQHGNAGKPTTAGAEETVHQGISEQDEVVFNEVTTIGLSAAQQAQIVSVAKTFPRRESVMAVHWHPEFIPMPLIEKRIQAMFPDMRNPLIIPTQHNSITALNGLAGVEMDCYAWGFNQKVQLLLHFVEEKIKKADRLKAMLAHTFNYRSSQLFDFLHTLTKPVSNRIDEAAGLTGADQKLITFTRAYAAKISELIERHGDAIDPQMVKNKLVRNFFDCLRPQYGDAFIDRVQTFLKAVKATVKRQFPLRYFYRVSEVIEETRALGGGIVVPHPEQFWPILLADYDVDGYEVWNPQSRRYTEFLIEVITKKNRPRGPGGEQLLVFMGDDTHMGEKIRGDAFADPEKTGREIGLQQAWEDVSIRKALIRADIDKRKIMSAYRDRLGCRGALKAS